MLLFVDLTRFMLALLIFTQHIYIFFFHSIVVTSYMFICPYQIGQTDTIGKAQLQVQE